MTFRSAPDTDWPARPSTIQRKLRDRRIGAWDALQGDVNWFDLCGLSVVLGIVPTAVLGCQNSPSPAEPALVSADGGPVLLTGSTTTLACGQGPTYIAIDDTYVYWSSCGDGVNPNGAIGKFAKTGGVAIPVASGLVCPQSIAVDGTNVYWRNGGPGLGPTGAVMKVAVEGGNPLVLASDSDYPSSLAVDSTSVYWTDGDAINTPGSVMRIPLDGGTPTAVASGRDQPGGMFVDGTGAYWIDYGTGNDAGSILWLPVDDTIPKVLATGQNPGSLVRDGSNTYWTTGSSVVKLQTNGLSVKLATSLGTAGSIAVAGETIYWGTSMDEWAGYGCCPTCSCGEPPQKNTISSVPASGGAPETLIAWSGYGGLGGIAADATSVYWATGGCVMKYRLR
jgi:hypothetical protein